MNIVVFGANGQVGSALVTSLAPLGSVFGLTRSDVDLLDEAAIRTVIQRLHPDLIVNAAAYTAVDQAETEPALATAINGVASGVMARAAAEVGALLIYYSTDYVFDGAKAGRYVETDRTRPLNAYGTSKLSGEEAIAAGGCDWLVLRTTWVFAAEGKNFVRTMLRLAAERASFKVIDDQHGAPTFAAHLAAATAEIARKAEERRKRGTFISGIYHLTGSGSTSWHGFAEEIVKQWRELRGPDALRVVQIEAIPSSQYPTPAARPKNSLLSNQKVALDYGIQMPSWHAGLSECLASLTVSSA